MFRRLWTPTCNAQLHAFTAYTAVQRRFGNKTRAMRNLEGCRIIPTFEMSTKGLLLVPPLRITSLRRKRNQVVYQKRIDCDAG